MGNARYALALLGRSWGHERAGAYEKHLVKLPRAHLLEDRRAEDGGAAAAA